MTVRELIEKLQELGPARLECPVTTYEINEMEERSRDLVEISFDGFSCIELEFE